MWQTEEERKEAPPITWPMRHWLPVLELLSCTTAPISAASRESVFQVTACSNSLPDLGPDCGGLVPEGSMCTGECRSPLLESHQGLYAALSPHSGSLVSMGLPRGPGTLTLHPRTKATGTPTHTCTHTHACTPHRAVWRLSEEVRDRVAKTWPLDPAGKCQNLSATPTANPAGALHPQSTQR